MTTAPVMTITEEFLAELEFLAVATDGWYSEHWSDMTLHADEDVAFVRKASPCAILALIAHIRSLTKRMNEVERDSERYQWLRDNEQLDCSAQTPAVRHAAENYAGAMFDSAIDAAIAKEGADHE